MIRITNNQTDIVSANSGSATSDVETIFSEHKYVREMYNTEIRQTHAGGSCFHSHPPILPLLEHSQSKADVNNALQFRHLIAGHRRWPRTTTQLMIEDPSTTISCKLTQNMQP